jgi:hypothetical protein
MALIHGNGHGQLHLIRLALRAMHYGMTERDDTEPVVPIDAPANLPEGQLWAEVACERRLHAIGQTAHKPL